VVDVALLGLAIGFVAGVVAMAWDMLDDLDWGWGDAVAPLVVLPTLVSASLVAIYGVALLTLLG